MDAARHSLARLGMCPTEVEKHIANIETTQLRAFEETKGASYLDCFRGTNRRRTMVAVMPLVIQALSGVAFIGGYTTYYFELAGNDVHRSFQLSCGQQALSISGNLVSWLIIDRFGRRPLITYGLMALTVLLLITGGTATSATPGALNATVGFIMLYAFVYNAVIGSIGFTIAAEMPTNTLRTKTVGLALMFQQALYTVEVFVLPYIFNPNQGNLGAKTTFIFGGFSVLCCIYLFFCQPETANRSFQEIDELFAKKVPARKFKSFVTDSQTESEVVAAHEGL